MSFHWDRFGAFPPETQRKGNEGYQGVSGTHMKSEDVSLHASINEKVWSRGSQKPPARIRVKACEA